MDLLLHVGLHKTGTTTAQACLHASSQALKHYGILYPSTGLWGDQHALIPCCLIGDHPILGRLNCGNSLQEVLGALQAELDEFRPSLVVVSSEVFTEVIGDREACLGLIKALSGLFSRITVLISLRDVMAMALSSLKHLVREHFFDSDTRFNDAFLNPVASYFQVALASEQAIRFWRESGLPLQERHLEGVSGSIADCYFGDIFDQYNGNARQLLSPETNAAIEPLLRLNSDELAPVAYLLLFLLGNSRDSSIFVAKNTLAIVFEECRANSCSSVLCDSFNHNQLLGYFDYFSKADPSSLPQYIPISQKLNALTHAGLTPAEILDLFAIVHRVKLRVAAA
jgi:hypothetical protein